MLWTNVFPPALLKNIIAIVVKTSAFARWYSKCLLYTSSSITCTTSICSADFAGTYLLGAIGISEVVSNPRRYQGYQPYFLPKELYKFVSGVAFHKQWTTATYGHKYHGPPTPTAAQGGPPHHRQSDRTLPTGRLDATSTDSWLRLRWRATALAAKV